MRGDILGLIDAEAAVEAGNLTETIKPLLAGKDPGIQGAALADLLAIWLAGHIVPGDPATQDELREALLQSHVDIVRLLLPLADAEREAKMRGGVQ